MILNDKKVPLLKKQSQAVKKYMPLWHKIVYAVGGLLVFATILIFLGVLSLIDRESPINSNNVKIISPEPDYLGGVHMNRENSMPISEGMYGEEMPQVAKNMMLETTLSDEIINDIRIIKNGNLTVQVDNIDWAAQKIDEIAKNFNGSVVRSNFYEAVNGVKSGTITVKVPVFSFEDTFNELKKVASLVVQENTNSSDVTAQYVDLQAQLSNKQKEEQAFADILTRSGDIDDVLKVTKELSRVRGEIERLQGRIKVMENQTDMSTITINLSEDVELAVSKSWRPWEVIKASIKGLLNDSQSLVDFLLEFIIRGIPMIAVFLFVLWLIYKAVRKVFNKMLEK